jgi:hypothetical protein
MAVYFEAAEEFFDVEVVDRPEQHFDVQAGALAADRHLDIEDVVGRIAARARNARRTATSGLGKDLEVAGHHRVPGAAIGRADAHNAGSTHAIPRARLLPRCDAETPAGRARRFPRTSRPHDHRHRGPAEFVGPFDRAHELPPAQVRLFS